MHKVRLLLLLLALVPALTLPSLAQQPGERPAGGPQGPGPAAGSPVTVSGQIVQLQTLGGQVPAVQAVLRCSTGDVPVFLGPVDFLAKQSVKLAKGDQVTVTGSRIADPQAKGLIRASSVKKGNQTLTLRDASGKPLWAPEGPPPRPAGQGPAPGSGR